MSMVLYKLDTELSLKYFDNIFSLIFLFLNSNRFEFYKLSEVIEIKQKTKKTKNKQHFSNLITLSSLTDCSSDYLIF